MASSALSILSGIGAAAAGLAGEKVPKSGVIPGLDLAAIIPLLLGGKAGGGNLLGTIATVASKSGVLKGSNLESLADLAGTLLSTGKADKKSASAKDGIGGLAAMIMGGSGTGANLASIASMAMKLGKKAEDEKELTGMASELGKTLSGSFGVSLGGSAKAVSGLSKTLEGDTKSVLFQSILKGIVK